MGRTRNSTIIVLGALLVIALGATILVERTYGQDPYKEIKAFWKEYEEAWGKRDIERISKLLHEDAKITHSKYGTLDKKAFLDSLPERFEKYPYVDFKLKKKNIKLTENGADLVYESGAMLQENMKWYYSTRKIKLVLEDGKWLLLSGEPK